MHHHIWWLIEMLLMCHQISEVNSQNLQYDTPGSPSIVSTAASPRNGALQTTSKKWLDGTSPEIGGNQIVSTGP